MKSINDIRRGNLDKTIGDSPFSQTALSRLMGLTSPSIVNQHVRGTKAIGDKFARRYEEALSLPVNWLDTDHSSGASMTFGKNILETPLDIGDGYLLIPQLKIADGLIEDIKLVSHNEGKRFPVHTSWFRDARVSQEEVATMQAQNDDMAPRIRRGDTMLLSAGESFSMTSGDIYVMAMNGELIVRRMFTRPDNGLRLISDNADKQRHPDWEVSKEDADSITFIAKVIYTFGKVE